MKTVWEVICELGTIESYFTLIGNALAGQGPDTGYVGREAWKEIFSDLSGRLQDTREALENIEGGQNA